MLKNRLRLAYHVLSTPRRNATVRAIMKSSALQEYPCFGEAIHRMVHAASTRAWLDDEVWVNDIEAVRQELLSSETTFEMQDFGAGVGNQHHNNDTEPIVKTRSLAEATKVGSKSKVRAYMLYLLISTCALKTGIELGTNVGISAAYQGHALKNGALHTIEGDPTLADTARHYLSHLGLGDVVTVHTGAFDDVMPGLLQRLGQVDYAFVDGNHKKEATLRYFEMILPYLAEGSVVVFDDIRWSEGMRAAWDSISSHASIAIAVDFIVMGICLINRSNPDTISDRYQIRLYSHA